MIPAIGVSILFHSPWHFRLRLSSRPVRTPDSWDNSGHKTIICEYFTITSFLLKSEAGVNREIKLPLPRRGSGILQGIRIIVSLLLFTAWAVRVFPGPVFGHTPQEKAFYLQSRIVLRLNPRDTVAGNAVGVWHLEYNQLEKAAQAFAKVLAIDPRNQTAAVGSALIDEIRGNFAGALKIVNAITEGTKGLIPFRRVVRARLLFRLEKYREAEQELTNNIPSNALPHDLNFWMGRIREKTNRPLEAIAYYNKAIEADPFWPEPYSRLSVLQQEQGNHEQARKVLADLLHLRNPSPYPNADIGILWGWVMRSDRTQSASAKEPEK